MDLLFAWIASVASGITPLVIKASSKSLVKDPWLFNILWVGFGIPLVVLLALLKGGGLPANWISIGLLSLSSACFYIFYTTSLYRLDVTTISPLFSLRTVFAVLLGLIFLNESISGLGIALIVSIILVSPLAAYDQKLKVKAFFHKNVLLVIFAMFSLALMGYFTNISVARNGYATTLLWQDLITLIILLPTLKFANIRKQDVVPKKFIPFLLLGVTGFIYTAASTLAYAHNLALSSVIVSMPLSMVFAYVLSRMNKKYSEHHPPKVYVVRFLGASVMVFCAVWLSFIS
jgi:drug/metabolite transporter (DMT)-like permease